MKQFLFSICFLMGYLASNSQTNPNIHFFPTGTILKENISYSVPKHPKKVLDIYLPKNAKTKNPFIVFIHGGAWMSNDKYADMGYMTKTMAALIDAGIAIVSIDYRFSTEAIFPAQIQDCNEAIAFINQHAQEYGLDMQHMGLMGFSAGGHLVNMLGLSNNNRVKDFYVSGNELPSFNIKAVVDFYGPSDLMLFHDAQNPKSAEALLLGAAPLDRPDLAKKASPINYIDKMDPPFLIIQGEKDESVDPKQSQLLSAWLQVTGVPNELIIVKDAPHYGVMFDAEDIRLKVIHFLDQYLLH